MAKKPTSMDTVSIQGVDYYTVSSLANKYNVHPTTILDMRTKLKLATIKIGNVSLNVDDPRLDPTYIRPRTPNPGAFKKGDDDRRVSNISYGELCNLVRRVDKEIVELKDMVRQLLYSIRPSTINNMDVTESDDMEVVPFTDKGEQFQNPH